MKRTCFSSLAVYARILADGGSGMVMKKRTWHRHYKLAKWLFGCLVEPDE